MRVALLTFNAQAADAIGNQVAEKLAFFLARGADVRVFLESDRRLHPAVRPHARIVEPTDLPEDAWAFLSSADLVIAEFGQSYGLLNLLPVLAENKPRILLDYHGITPPEWWGPQHREALTRGLQQRGLVWCGDAAATHSRFTCQELLTATGFPGERLFRLGYPLATERFGPGAVGRPLREQLGIGEARVLLFVGRVAPNKRVPVLAEAVARLRDLHPPIHAALIGDTSDVYQEEMRRCQESAARHGVTDRVHFLGRVSDEQLRDAYRSADVLVMPSRHEGFCIPVLEAMACQLPVVAARAGALPETVADGGLTFTPDDAEDLARTIRRVLADSPTGSSAPAAGRSRHRIAVVCFRYGDDFVGGAETSLRTIALALHRLGDDVEVLTTCTRDEDGWSNQLPEGQSRSGGIPVQRFRIERHDRERYRAAVRALLQADGVVPQALEAEYLAHSVHSGKLLAALRQRIQDFDAVIVGPYLNGLTVEVARQFPEQTLLLPCFHDEPFARWQTFREVFGQVAGILYHTAEEQDFAQAVLGLNHPGAFRIGTFLGLPELGRPERGRALAGGGRRYAVYCGRYSAEKGLPTLLDHARRYAEEHPERFMFVFVGRGDVPLPREEWCQDLGFLEEAAKRDVLAGADLLVQLSSRESLSLVALEAWAHGVPVLASALSEVLQGHLHRGGGGRSVQNYEDFAEALDDLWQRPEDWRSMGRRGQEYVGREYGSLAAFQQVLRRALEEMQLPLAERMRRRGLVRAETFSRAAWSDRFARLVENVLDAPARPFSQRLEVRPRSPTRVTRVGQEMVLVPVRVLNQGTHAAVPDGPARIVLRSQVFDEEGRQPRSPAGPAVPLPGLLMPGQDSSAAIPVRVPPTPGPCQVAFWAERGGDEPTAVPGTLPAESWLRMAVQEDAETAAEHCCAPLLAVVQSTLAEAHTLQRLPDDYRDVTQGRFARLKRWIKSKLLGNFKHAYVDVLSRQQSAFNQRMLTALQELAECCETLEHAGRVGAPAKPEEASVAALRARVQELERRLAELETSPRRAASGEDEGAAAYR